ncbi:uncharacterized protein LOC126733354 isoform X2 [Quercus robur]|uniref:uncharacterized protein LOC126733354 isoform X2 n=1 Tax=Quercus robur TaxID=38942 RepID=UPI002161DE40|nr:uncharacterized protein LOC126733354 isoform X2 [Quercus robur]XP_050292567.1 uncharacterized protein LOC126733354 isoform X2 [Quercus robur]
MESSNSGLDFEFPVEESTIYSDLGDLGYTAGPSEDGYDLSTGSPDNCLYMSDLEKPLNFAPEAGESLHIPSNGHYAGYNDYTDAELFPSNPCGAAQLISLSDLSDPLPQRPCGFMNVSHNGAIEAAFPFDVSEIIEELGDLGNTSGLSHKETAEAAFLFDVSEIIEELGDLGNISGLSHNETSEAAFPFDVSEIIEELGDLGYKSGLNHNGTADTAFPFDVSAIIDELGDLGNTSGLVHNGTIGAASPFDVSEILEEWGDLCNTSGLGHNFSTCSLDDCINIEDLEKLLNCLAETDESQQTFCSNKKDRKRKRKERN